MSDVEPGELEKQWQHLEAWPPHRDEFPWLPRQVAALAEPARLALGPDSRWHLLIPVEDAGAVPEDRRSKGVHLAGRILEEGGGDEVVTRAFADLVCNLTHLRPLFTRLTRDVLEAIRSPETAARDVHQVLLRWRELLERRSSVGMGEDEAVGLFGELHILFWLLDFDATAVRIWEGPEGARHDFRAGPRALEVKTSLGRKNRTCTIHGADQLEPPLDGTLHLFHLRVEKDRTGRSLVEQVEEVRRKVHDRAMLDDKLALAGYDEDPEGMAPRLRLRVMEAFLYEVDESFPQVVPRSFRGGIVPAGVTDLRYIIDLSGELPRPLDGKVEEEVLRNLCSEAE